MSRLDEERVTFIADEDRPGKFLPQISSAGMIRHFEADDMARVLDFDNVAESPKDGSLMFCEYGDDEGIRFPVYHFCLRGGYLFYFDVEDVDDDAGPYAVYHSSPLGVVPLSNIAVEFPPGGRRVFREHAQTDARTGYELAIVHIPDDQDEGQPRVPAFLVADSLSRREKWAVALRARSEVVKPTMLRAVYNKTRTAAPALKASFDEEDMTNADNQATEATDVNTSIKNETLFQEIEQKSRKVSKGKREGKSITQQVMEVSDDAELAQAVVEFGVADFDENEWMENFFQTHSDFDAPGTCRQMERWQTDMKKSLKGAVLEQYEYFVQASGEMTTMGEEVAALKALIDAQVVTLKNMKDIDFTEALTEIQRNESAISNDAGAMEPPRLNKPRAKSKNDILDDLSEYSSVEGSSRNQRETIDEDEENEGDAPLIEIPSWLSESFDEISSFLREGRLNDAIELYNKSKSEIMELVDKHERPTLYRLKKVELENLRVLQKNLDSLCNRISIRICETLRRRNEALKQATKKERSDPHAASLSIVSPCALNDDSLYLHLLVKLGKTQEAAEAYTSRRSLLLLETLHERPISGSGTVDLVIYAAQLSQGFFSCLASSVEGFLDLFYVPATKDEKNEDTNSLADSSLHSIGNVKNAPAGAMSSIVLWCDAELAKFASAFGGARILANLALSPPPRDAPKGPRVLGLDDANGSKERRNAIEVAAQCIDQAFLYASENLDTVGLPLTARLAECLRSRLKGCEAEVADLLDERWHSLTFNWKNPETVDDL